MLSSILHIRRACSIDVGRRVSFSSFNILTDLTAAGGPQIGSFAELQHSFSQKDVDGFALLSGDNNPIHINQAFAAESMFGGTIVHGILVSSLFSTLFGRSIHGCIYVNQSLNFKSPVHVGSAVMARVEVEQMKKSSKGVWLTCKTSAFTISQKSGEKVMAIDGSATVLIPTPRT